MRNELNLFNFIDPFSWIIQVLLREIFKDNENDSNNERLIILFVTNLKQLYKDFIIRTNLENIYSHTVSKIRSLV